MRIDNPYGDLSREGFRTLGAAWREVPADHQHADLADESELVFAGVDTATT